MAIVTLDFATFGGGAVVVNFDYNDVNGNVVRVRGINNSAHAAIFTVLNNDVQALQVTLPAGQTATQNVSNINLSWDTVEGGLLMGAYQFQARWPA